MPGASHPSENLELGQVVKVKVLKYDQELSRLSLGIKQLTEDPWDKISENIEMNQKILLLK